MTVKTDKPMVLRDSLFFVVEVLLDVPGADLALAELIESQISPITNVEQARSEILRLAHADLNR